ncbi:MAG: hypothetical protein JXL97_04305 [Bacteroidales bacterium]|nr:hypothetical protein [Bacteroidales bacterium]
MKKLSLVLTGILMVFFVFTSCQKEKGFDENSLPAKFKIDIPDAISNSSNQKSVMVDEVNGDEIYEHLRFFIAVGEGAADITQNLIYGIRQYDLDQAMTFSFVSDDDGRTKNVTVIENGDYDGKTWQFQLTLTDAEAEMDEDGGYAMQIFWNNNPVQGIAILKPYNINRSDSLEAWVHGIFRIDYSEAGEYGYEQSMIVSIDELPLPADEPYAISSMKMFVGKTGNIVDVYGNSGHRNAIFFNSAEGFDWAFVAAGNQVSNLGVAEVGLPPYTLDSDNRTVLLKDYSIHTVFTNLITDWYFAENGVNIDSLTLAAYLENAEAPGFFNQDGFIGSGDAPTSDFDELVSSIAELSPYNPATIANLTIEFKETGSAK